MQIGEQGLAAGEPRDLGRLRFLDLENQLGVAKDPLDVRLETRAHALIFGIGVATALPGARLDDHLMALGDQLTHTGRREGDAILVVLDFLRHGNLHGELLALLAECTDVITTPATSTADSSASRQSDTSKIHQNTPMMQWNARNHR